MRILPWGFAQRTSPKFFWRANFFPSVKIKKDRGRLGEGDKLFSVFIAFIFFFPACRNATCKYKSFSFCFLIFVGVLTTNCKKFKNKEKHRLSFFTAFHLPRDASHSQKTSKAQFSVNHISSFKICFTKVVAFCERNSSVRKLIFCSKTLNQL